MNPKLKEGAVYCGRSHSEWTKYYPDDESPNAFCILEAGHKGTHISHTFEFASAHPVKRKRKPKAVVLVPK
jgi:hypothetical protein